MKWDILFWVTQHEIITAKIFLFSLLQANGLSNERNILFTKQSTTGLFSTEMTKLTNTITDIAGKIDIIREGGNLLY